MTAAQRVERELHALEMIHAGIAQGLEFAPKKSPTAKAFQGLLVDVDCRIDSLREQAGE